MRVPTFREFVSSQTPQRAILPLAHTTTGLGFQKILNSGQLMTKLCPVMKAERVFLFLGIPAYKYGDPRSQDKRLTSAPVCFLLDRNAVGSDIDTFPFDTGCLSFAKKEYNLGNEIDPATYAIKADGSGPERIITALYGDTAKYLEDSPFDKNAPKPNSIDFETSLLSELFGSSESNAVDERISTIEVQSPQALHISRDNVLAIVAPDIVAETPEMEAICADLDADVVRYRWRRASNYQRATQITDAVLDYIEEKGLV